MALIAIRGVMEKRNLQSHYSTDWRTMFSYVDLLEFDQKLISLLIGEDQVSELKGFPTDASMFVKGIRSRATYGSSSFEKETWFSIKELENLRQVYPAKFGRRSEILDIILGHLEIIKRLSGMEFRFLVWQETIDSLH